MTLDIEQQSKEALKIASKVPPYFWDAICYSADNGADVCTIQVRRGPKLGTIEKYFKAFLSAGDYLAGKVTSRGPYIPNNNFVRRRSSFEIRGRGLLESFADYYRNFGIPKQK